MTTDEELKVNHHSYVVPGVDGAVMNKQAEARRDKEGEITIVHQHGRGRSCNNYCKMFEPGYKTRPLNTERVKADADESD